MGSGPHQGAQSPTNPVTYRGGADRTADRIRDARGHRLRIGDHRHPERTHASTASVASEPVEDDAVPDAPDHAERRTRPLARRDFRMARPARVDMRCRNPCRLARLRLFGWYVRFTLPPGVPST